ncbi:MAG: VOC family protein [Pseudomonadota bacterium]
MQVERICAHLSCRDVDASADWFAGFWGRPADVAPMDGLREWHMGPAGFQLWGDPDQAGAGTMTVIIADLEAERARLRHAGYEPSPITPGGDGRLCQMRDPDGNLVVLVGA